MVTRSRVVSCSARAFSSTNPVSWPRAVQNMGLTPLASLRVHDSGQDLTKVSLCWGDLRTVLQLFPGGGGGAAETSFNV